MQTLDKIILNLGEHEFSSGLTYTALSRAKKLQDIAFEVPLSFDRIMEIFNLDRFRQRLAEEERLSQLP